MKKTNQRPAPIAWRKGDFVAIDVPLARPVHYTNAVRLTAQLVARLMKGAV
jgi:hypothetical protein